MLLASLSLEAAGGTADDAAGFQERCGALAEFAIPSSEINLPTRGAAVKESRLAPAGGDNDLGEYCLVLGEVAAVSASAQPIRFQLALPTRWNRKMLQRGSGGLRGVAISPVVGTANLPSRDTVARGYAVFANGSGHMGKPADASFALEAEQLANFAGERINKTFDAVSAIVERYYGQAAEYSYFMGGSSGGREAVTAMRDYAGDYQGVIAIYPDLGFTRMVLRAQLVLRAMTRDDGAGRIDGVQAGLLREQVLAACDGGDGLEDGILSNPESCRFDFDRLRCPDEREAGAECFSDAQLDTLQLMHSPVQLNYRFRDGQDSLPAHAIGTEWTSWLLNLGGEASSRGIPVLGMYRLLPPGFLKFMVARDPEFDVSGFDPMAPGALQPRLLVVAGMLDRVDADIGGYMERGGKLILVHGRADELSPERETIRFHDGLVNRYGEQAVNGAVAFYLVPGYGHGHGAGFRATGGMPLLPALEGWVENGVAPGTLTAVDTNRNAAWRTRPMCRYPAWPKYDGKGDPDRAASFRCADP